MNPVPLVPIPDIIRPVVNLFDDTIGESGRMYWRNEIVLEMLAMTNPCRCVAGQLFGGCYTEALTDRGGPVEDGSVEDRGLCATGIRQDEQDAHYERLESAWDEYLAACDEEMARLRGVTLDEITQALAPPPKDVKIYPGEDPYDVAGVVLPPDPE